jgi:hypothetical protein
LGGVLVIGRQVQGGTITDDEVIASLEQMPVWT